MSLDLVLSADACELLQREEQLALALSRKRLDPAAVEAIRDFLRAEASTIDWGRFVDICARHGVLHLVGHSLHAYDLTLGPTGQSLIPYRWLYAQVVHGNEGRNILQRDEFGRLLTSLVANKVDVIVRKGPAIIRDVHGGHLGVRRVGDMDLLIRPADVEQASTVIERRGYQCGHRTENRHELIPFDRRTSAFWSINLPNVHLPFLRVSDSDLVEVFVVDLCFSLFQPRSGLDFDFEDFWQRARPGRLWGALTHSLCPEDQLIDLAVQLHMEATIVYFIELGKDMTLLKLLELGEYVQVLSGDEAAAASLLTRAEQLGCADSLYYALTHVDLAFPSIVPSDWLELFSRDRDPADLKRYGAMDDEPAEWTEPFLTRLFTPKRLRTNASSSVPGPRAVI